MGVGFGIMGERLADEHCSVLPPGARKEHRSLTDLARATGTEEEIMAVFRAMRDVVTQRMDGLIARLREESAV